MYVSPLVGVCVCMFVSPLVGVRVYVCESSGRCVCVYVCESSSSACEYLKFIRVPLHAFPCSWSVLE